MFVIGSIYKRRELHEKYGGQRQGGISTPFRQNFIMLFTGKTGQQYGYNDGWSKEGIFSYAGEGQSGDMSFSRGNLAIREHAVNSKDLHLFEYVRPGYVRYMRQMICTGFHELRGLDKDGNDRRVIIFELTPIAAFSEARVLDDEEKDEEMWQEDLKNLRERAIVTSTAGTRPSERRALVRYRSRAIRIYVLKRANGVCEACGKNAPFKTDLDRPYLEPHHIRCLSDGGPDDPRYVIAVCPNCHRRAHYGKDRSEFNKRLENIVHDKENQNGV